MTHLEPSRFERGLAFETPSRSTRIRSADNVRQEATFQRTCSAMAIEGKGGGTGNAGYFERLLG
jgi:hypothetical protein